MAKSSRKSTLSPQANAPNSCAKSYVNIFPNASVDVPLPSSSTTSTLSTTTLCFVSSTSAVTTCGKRKRALGVHELGDLADIQIASSAVLR